MTPHTSIFYVTFARDLEFMRYSLRSIRKFCRCFQEIVVLVPNQDVQAFKMFDGMVDIPYHVIGFEEVAGKGMLHHEALVMSADKFCSGDAVLHMDPDVVFWEDAEPSDYFKDGKAILYREKFDNFRHYAARYGWRACVQDALGGEPEWEYMVRHPAVHWREIYAPCREAIQQHTGQPFMDYMLSGKNDFPQSRAEFPTLGTWVERNCPDRYHFVDYAVTAPDGSYDYRHGKDKVKAFWSHGGTEGVRVDLDIITR